MTAHEQLSEFLKGRYRIEFKTVIVIRNFCPVARIPTSVYLGRDEFDGEDVAMLDYSAALEEIQKYGAMKSFRGDFCTFPCGEWRTLRNGSYASPIAVVDGNPDNLITITSLSVNSDPTSGDCIVMSILLTDDYSLSCLTLPSQFKVW